MRILFVSSEAVPFAKTGGLADVASGLCKALANAGHDVVLALPCHRRFIDELARGTAIGEVEVQMRARRVRAKVLETVMDDSPLRVWLIDQPNYFDRGALYTEGDLDYADNSERYMFFSRAVLEAARNQYLLPDIVHANDWQTGLVPAIVREQLRHTTDFAQVGTIFTIHNMAFHGSFPPHDMELTGMPQKYFNWRQMEFYGRLNLLKTGITFADYVTTVSPTYAREICSAQYGYGLDAALIDRGEHLVGILNGVDLEAWHPAHDPLIPQQYDAETVQEGKAVCKARLQKELGLHENKEALLFGMVSRLSDQKGFDLLSLQVHKMLEANVQLAFLGGGEARYHQMLEDLQRQYPGRVAVRFGMQERLAHWIEAGADAYLMPSRFEPCGLNQQYSLLYGTLPLVHATGGLADSVVDATEENLLAGTATGFSFRNYTPEGFIDAVWRAVGMFQYRKDDWRQMQQTGMRLDLSWESSAAKYLQLYERALWEVAHAAEDVDQT
jgi:starch synthase